MRLCVGRAGTFSVGRLLMSVGVEVEGRGDPAGDMDSCSVIRKLVVGFSFVSRGGRRGLLFRTRHRGPSESFVRNQKFHGVTI